MSKHLYVGGNGSVHALDAATCAVVWSVELKQGWLISGSPFVSLQECGGYLCAFAYGTLYKIDKRTGAIIGTGEQIRKLKHRAGVFSTTADVPAATDAAAVIAGDCGDCDGGACGDAGGDGRDGGGD